MKGDKGRAQVEHTLVKQTGIKYSAVDKATLGRDADLIDAQLIAADRARRWACLIELEPKHGDVIVERWQTAAGGRS